MTAIIIYTQRTETPAVVYCNHQISDNTSQSAETCNKASMEMITNNTNRKHFEELKWSHLPASLLNVRETRNAVLTKQLRKNDHQQHSAKHEQTQSTTQHTLVTESNT